MVRQDYCGVLSEEAVRKNCVLVYELLDEVIDNGFPQSTSSEALKEYVLNVPIIVKSVRPRCIAGCTAFIAPDLTSALLIRHKMVNVYRPRPSPACAVSC